MRIVYAMAKKPETAPVAYIAAGTAMNVYAVYRSPPSRNQVTTVPKLRPPRPHSSSEGGAPVRRQLAAQKPPTVTRMKKNSSTPRATPSTLVLAASVTAESVWFIGLPACGHG